MSFSLKTFYTSVIIFLSIISYGQDIKFYRSDSVFVKAAENIRVNITPDVTPKIELPFNKFVFNDVRADTSCIGTRVKNTYRSEKKRYDKITLQNGTADALKDYCNTNFYFAGNNMSLACFIKQLRITELDTAGRNKEGAFGVYHRLKFTIECYIQIGEEFFPAMRIDTTATSFDAGKDDYSILADVLNSFAQKASLINTNECRKKHPYSLKEIQARYTARFEIPVLADSVLKEGVYRSYADFINNKPSVVEYELMKDKSATILYTKDKTGAFTPEMTALGFCDGKVIWLNVNNHLLPLIRQQNTFVFVSEKIIAQKKGDGTYLDFTSVTTLGTTFLVTTMFNTLKNTQTRKYVYALDLEDGTYY